MGKRLPALAALALALASPVWGRELHWRELAGRDQQLECAFGGGGGGGW